MTSWTRATADQQEAAIRAALDDLRTTLQFIGPMASRLQRYRATLTTVRTSLDRHHWPPTRSLLVLAELTCREIYLRGLYGRLTRNERHALLAAARLIHGIAAARRRSTH